MAQDDRKWVHIDAICCFCLNITEDYSDSPDMIMKCNSSFPSSVDCCPTPKVSARPSLTAGLIFRLCLELLIAGSVCLSFPAQASSEEIIRPMDEKFTFTYGSWENEVGVQDGKARLVGVDSKGGAGINVTMDLTAHAADTPGLKINVLAGNEASTLRLLLRDTSGRMGTWNIPLPSVAVEEFIALPRGKETFLDPSTQEKEDNLDLRNISQIQFTGDFSQTVLAVEISAVVALTPAEAAGLLNDPGRDQQLQPQGPVVLTDFSEPFLFAYSDWEGTTDLSDGQALINAPTSKGGAGLNISRDLTGTGNWSPYLAVEIMENHAAKKIRVGLQDSQERMSTFHFDLSETSTGDTITLDPIDGAALNNPVEGEKIDLADISQIQVQGDWSDQAVHLKFVSLDIAPPTEDVIRMRTAREERAREEAEAQRQAVEEARKNITHGPESPEIVHLGAVDRDILGITLIEGKLVRQAYIPYEPQEGDQIVEEGNEHLNERQGEIVSAKETRLLKRMVEGELVDFGYLAGGRDEEVWLWPFEKRTGDKLEKLTASDPESYLITGPGVFAGGINPVGVERKSKPIDRVFPSNDQIIRHRIYLRLPGELQDGAEYKISFPYLNANQREVTYTHHSKHVLSEAIHSSHIGYRPTDPFKRAFLSIWLGTGGAHEYDGLEKFMLLNEDREVVHEGRIELILPVDGIEKMRPEKNFSQTEVWAMDFSEFTGEGVFYAHVPGIGVSHPIQINQEESWKDAFKKSMHGFLAQRSGIELGPPFTTFKRERSLHPVDGVEVYQSTTTVEEAYATDNWFTALTEGLTEEELPGAWGGYHDAGDFDRNANHLWASYKHLELYELFPDYFKDLKLPLPKNEANDNIPDIINEAMWNIDLFRRLQKSDGGITGGLEATSHPNKGEDSVKDSLVWMAFAPDGGSSYIYAAIASKAARALMEIDPALSGDLKSSALKAWDFAEKTTPTGEGYQSVPPEAARNLAAAELLWLTGEERFDVAFKETTVVPSDSEILIDQQAGAFTYARLPEDLGGAALKEKIVERFREQADRALNYASNNAFGLTIEIKDMPLIGPVGAFTTPGMNSRILPRTHYLTGEEKYLAGTIRACNFSAGANPDNMTFTTGVGFHSPNAPLHFDSRFTGQAPPAGLTLYGAYDKDTLPDYAKGNEWVHIWLLPETTVPSSWGWPATEFYFDLFLWPMMNELTIRQNMGPTSYYWGYLAARDSS